jgi:type VI secretion system protein ImpC
LEPRQDPRQLDWAARADAAVGEQMRAILHHPQFQALEAAWRAVAMLIDRLQPDADLRLYLFDATLEELVAAASPEPSEVGQDSSCQPGALEKCFGNSQAPWSLLVGNYAFSRSAADAARLRWLGELAASLGAPFLGEAMPPADPPDEEYQKLVRSAEARWIGLALPRFLLRLPYGQDTSPTGEFAFEEMPQSVHEDYLWGNPAFFCACVLGLAFRAEGWEMHPARHREIGNLPLHIYREDGASVAKPCAEILLTDTDAEFILDHGFMPLASMKDRDSVLLVRLQSIAGPPAPLFGRWTGRR